MTHQDSLELAEGKLEPTRAWARAERGGLLGRAQKTLPRGPERSRGYGDSAGVRKRGVCGTSQGEVEG